MGWFQMLALKATLLHLELIRHYFSRNPTRKIEINFVFEPENSMTFARGIIRMPFVFVFFIVESGEKTDLSIGKVLALESTRLFGGCKMVNSRVKISFFSFFSG